VSSALFVAARAASPIARANDALPPPVELPPNHAIELLLWLDPGTLFGFRSFALITARLSNRRWRADVRRPSRCAAPDGINPASLIYRIIKVA
jgi:hypothetical protein